MAQGNADNLHTLQCPETLYFFQNKTRMCAQLANASRTSVAEKNGRAFTGLHMLFHTTLAVDKSCDYGGKSREHGMPCVLCYCCDTVGSVGVGLVNNGDVKVGQD